jgi:hypothetical protein
MLFAKSVLEQVPALAGWICGLVPQFARVDAVRWLLEMESDLSVKRAA